MFKEYLERWQLTPDGEPILTLTSSLFPVRSSAGPSILKIASLDEEKRGGMVMSWWQGNGAARVIARDENALLMERAEGEGSLAEFARSGRDDEATRIMCATLARLHAPRELPAPSVVPLAEWFESLGPVAEAQGGVLRFAATTASHLLESEQERVILHGDMHHGNVLDFGPRGWLAVDPKGLIGERTFDYANILCNPDYETAKAPGRLARQLDVIASAAHLDRSRLLLWVIAWAGLSAAFRLEDGLSPQTAIAIAELAAAEIAR